MQHTIDQSTSFQAWQIICLVAHQALFHPVNCKHACYAMR